MTTKTIYTPFVGFSSSLQLIPGKQEHIFGNEPQHYFPNATSAEHETNQLAVREIQTCDDPILALLEV